MNIVKIILKLNVGILILEVLLKPKIIVLMVVLILMEIVALADIIKPI